MKQTESIQQNQNRKNNIQKCADSRRAGRGCPNCADCGKECEIPFKPDQGRPTYCRECYLKRGYTY